MVVCRISLETQVPRAHHQLRTPWSAKSEWSTTFDVCVHPTEHTHIIHNIRARPSPIRSWRDGKSGMLRKRWKRTDDQTGSGEESKDACRFHAPQNCDLARIEKKLITFRGTPMSPGFALGSFACTPTPCVPTGTSNWTHLTYLLVFAAVIVTPL